MWGGRKRAQICENVNVENALKNLTNVDDVDVFGVPQRSRFVILA